MERNSKHRILGIAALIALIFGTANSIEYFAPNKNYLKEYTGIVSKAEYSIFTGKAKTRYIGRNEYGKNDIQLIGVNRNFFLTNEISDGAFIDIEPGDTVTIWVKRWFQFIYSPTFDSNIFFVDKSRIEVFENLKDWQSVTFTYMCVFWGLFFLLSIIYLDIVKGISLEKWFQKKVLKNPAYLNKKKK